MPSAHQGANADRLDHRRWPRNLLTGRRARELCSPPLDHAAPSINQGVRTANDGDQPPPGNHRAARRIPRRPDDRIRRRADLSDHELSVPRHRTCREPVRAQGVRQHLFAVHEPDRRRARAPRCRARRRRGGAGPGVRSGRVADGDSEHRPHRRQLVSSTDLYGGTWNLFNNTMEDIGIDVRFVDPSDPENFRRATDERTRAYYAERRCRTRS